nr:hypothetical protein CFP56_34124 [Quercus suber]
MDKGIKKAFVRNVLLGLAIILFKVKQPWVLHIRFLLQIKCGLLQWSLWFVLNFLYQCATATLLWYNCYWI